MKVYSPRIHNLGDFIHCLPVLSGLYKTYSIKISFGICDRLERFKGIKEFLLYQGIFDEVHFMHEKPVENNNYIILDDTGTDDGNGDEPFVTRRYYNFVKNTYNINFQLDDDFILDVPKYHERYDIENKIIVGDRWSPNQAPDVDERRLSNHIAGYEKFTGDRFFYLDYSEDLLYNLSIIKYNNNPFITTFTGIGILSDMIGKETHILWDDDLYNWDGKPIKYSFDMHYYKNRNSHLHYIKEFTI